ncbi:OsmC family protein [Chelatococcus sp. SYSU_G07232]|uniref:OsmC family protein n=1 Tax=Chelatococcus albus TaxID=3047466 RepID=A0ABT7AER1_9HYPH|nr:OsmC family protein [Chelatococcus sp. SYSU_G07232]MDJ1157845.1 OsmC family protein [Chelatococcus sp. SYSU_G07232]
MAHEYKATVRWMRESGAPFTDNRYSRGHAWLFDGGVEVPASSSPSVVPLPLSRADAVDPEEAFVAALSSCHMLFFLSFAAKRGFVVDRYEDAAIGVMGKNGAGKVVVTRVTLSPSIVFSGDRRPSPSDIAHLHHEAHEACFIANSVTTEVVIAEIPPIFAS